MVSGLNSMVSGPIYSASRVNTYIGHKVVYIQGEVSRACVAMPILQYFSFKYKFIGTEITFNIQSYPFLLF